MPTFAARTLGVAARFIHAEPERESCTVRRPLDLPVGRFVVAAGHCNADSAPEGMEIGLVLREKDKQSLDLSDMMM